MSSPSSSSFSSSSAPSSSSSSSSSPFSFPPLVVSDDAKESYPPSLFAPAQPNYRTIDALPSPSSAAAASFTSDNQPLYRSTAALASEVDDSAQWAEQSDAAFGHKVLTLNSLRDGVDNRVQEAEEEEELTEERTGEPAEEAVSSQRKLPPLPPLPSDFEERHSLECCAGCDAVMAALVACVKAFYHSVSWQLHPSKPRLSGVFYHRHAPVCFQVNAFAADGVAGNGSPSPSASTSTVIEVQRRSGDLRLFQSFFLCLQEQLAQRGLVKADTQQPAYAMESLSPPSLGEDEEDDAALELVVQDMWRAKAASLNHADARDGLRGLLAPSSPRPSASGFRPLPLSELCPIIHRALGNTHDPEQQRLAFTLLNHSLAAPASPSTVSAHVQPLVPALFASVGELPSTYHSLDAARVLARICDSMETHPQLAPLVAEQGELVEQVRRMASIEV